MQKYPKLQITHTSIIVLIFDWILFSRNLRWKNEINLKLFLASYTCTQKVLENPHFWSYNIPKKYEMLQRATGQTVQELSISLPLY